MVNPEAPKDLGTSVKNLRRWIRLLARSTELQLASPDASLLIKAVDKLGQPHLGDSAAIFRVQAFRLQHGADHQPSYAIAVSLAQLYLAELETLTLMAPESKRQRVSALQEGGTQSQEAPMRHKSAKRNDKGGKQENAREPPKETCRQFNSEKGCPRGNACKYLHKPTEGGMTGRCFNCGGAHLKAECTSPGGGAADKPPDKPPQTPKHKARKAYGQAPNLQQVATSDSVPLAAAPQSQNLLPEPQSLGPAAAQALKEAATSLRQELLKAIKAVGIDSAPDDLGSGRKGLIDGGATSCLRTARSAFEWKEAVPTTIHLAVGETEARTSAAGVLLLPPGTLCDPIVALHELVRIGYRMTFLEVGKIRVWRPGKPDLQVDCSSGCPEIPVSIALDLIREVERSKVLSQQKLARLTSSHATFEDALSQLPVSGEEMVAWFRTIVPSIPDRLLPELAVPACKQARPFNRRRRRALLKAKNVVIHLCPGGSRGMFEELPFQQGWDVVEIDVEEDLHDPTVFGFLLLLAARGIVRALVGGPPCRTFSALRHRDQGPEPVRGTGEESWGLRHLTQAQQASTDRDSLLFLKMLLLGSVARRAVKLHRVGSPKPLLSAERFCFLIEQPEDPVTVLGSPVDDRGRPYSSLWRWPAWLEWSQVEGATMLSLDQGPLGHVRRKPTTLGMIGPGWCLQPVRGASQVCNQAPHPTQGFTTVSGEWAAWAPGLKTRIVAFVSFQISLRCPSSASFGSDSSSTEGEEDSEAAKSLRPAAKVMSREEIQRSSWAQHLAQDHLPRRRDCYHCLAGEFPHKAHHRVSIPQAYCLGVDLLGPLVPGEHETGKGIRYGLVGVYTFPKVLTPMDPSQRPHDSGIDRHAPDGVDGCRDVVARHTDGVEDCRGVGEGLRAVSASSLCASGAQATGLVPATAFASSPGASGAQATGLVPATAFASSPGASGAQATGLVPATAFASSPGASGAQATGLVPATAFASSPCASGAQAEGVVPATVPHTSGAQAEGVVPAAVPHTSGAQAEGVVPATVPHTSGAQAEGVVPATVPHTSGAQAEGVVPATVPHTLGVQAEGVVPATAFASTPHALNSKAEGVVSATVFTGSLRALGHQATGAISATSSAAMPQLAGYQATGAVPTVSVCHVSGSSSAPAPPSAVEDFAEDDHLSQLFPDDLPDLSDGEIVLDDPASASPGPEPLSESELAEAEAQATTWWKDKPLTHVPMLEVPFFVPLPDKHGKTVLDGLMRIHTEVRALGLPLVRLHSDRGREFINRKVTAWTAHHGIAQTSTSGDDWKANGRTENWVRLLKRSTRTLLMAHRAEPTQWAFAMRHCAARLQAAALHALGVPQPRLLPWYATLALRKRSWETKQPWESRATRATVLCPSPILRGGHLVKTAEGSFVHTEALLEVAEVVELQAYEPSKPATRLRGKQPFLPGPASPSAASSATLPARPLVAGMQHGGGGDTPRPAGFGGAAFGGDSGFLRRQPKRVRFDVPSSPRREEGTSNTFSISRSESIAYALERSSRVSAQSVLALVQSLEINRNEESRVDKWDVWTFGVYASQEGPKVAPATRAHPCLVKLLCKVVRTCDPQFSFAAVRIRYNQGQRCQRDLEIAEETRNLMMPLSTFRGGQLWVEDETASDADVVFRAVPGDLEVCLRRGRLFPTSPFLVYDPRGFHEVQESQGDRWILEAFTPRNWHKLPAKHQTHLASLGFSLPPCPLAPSDTSAVCMMAFDVTSSGHLCQPAYECVAASQVLSQCRASVMKVLDQVQDNLKRWTSEVKSFWGWANGQGEGEASAELLRDTEGQVCALQDTLEKARALETEECPPISPPDRWKELAYLYEEPGFEPRVCVAHTQGGPDSTPTSGDIPLQTRTLTLGEVLAELELWKPSWGEEYNSLVTTHQAVEPLPAESLRDWRAQGKKFQIIPSKLVHTLKAHTGRKKTRCVCCGNMEEVSLFNRSECYAGGVDATALRAVLRTASAWEWSISSFDVRTAFLQSPLLDKHDVPTVVKTPWLWRKHGICNEEYWLVKGALYGLCISPRSWCESRDATMSHAHMCQEGCKVFLRRFESDPNLWWIVKVEPEGVEAQVGIVAWYIDDALILARQDLAKSLTEFIAGLWNTTPPEYLVPGQVLVYNGFEIEQEGPCLRLHQRSFLTELLSRYPGSELADIPALPVTPREAEEANAVLTRKCQALCGELLWLSIRTRPEICYAVNMMAQRMAKWPREAWDRGLQVVKYLRKHPGVALAYGVPKTALLARATALSDASFAPSGERSHQCTLTLLGDSLITWHSSRQPFITQSTCEAELVALCSALSDLEAQLPLFQELLPASSWTKELLCDNKSAVAICQAPFGSWRSRHLHLRANVVKERLTQGWTLRHQPGAEMLADIGTKPLASGRFLELMLGLGLHVPLAVPTKPLVKAVSFRTRPPLFQGEGLDVESVPSEAKCQSLLRAWILLEIIGSLPVSEAAPMHRGLPATDASAMPSAVVSGIVLAMLWYNGLLKKGKSAVAVLCVSFAIHHGSSDVLPSWMWILALGFGLGWSSRAFYQNEVWGKDDEFRQRRESSPLLSPEEAALSTTARKVAMNPLNADGPHGLWVAYGDDLKWIEDPSDICFPRLYLALQMKDFARLRLTCQGLREKVSLILRREDRDRSLLDQGQRDFLEMPGVIARGLGRESSYEPSNSKIRQWEREFREAEDRLLDGPNSEEEEYDPEEHVSFHAALAAYYLTNLGYQFDVGDTDPEFELWYARIVENPPPIDLRESAARITSAASFLNFQGYFFDHEQLPDDLLEEYEEQLGRRHIQEYRDL